MAERYYCPDAARGGLLRLEGAEAAHLARVRRVAAGETVTLFDGDGFATAAVVREVARDRVELEAIGPPLPDRVAPLELTLATAVPKGDRFDWLVEKATELGVARLIPIVTERSVVDPRAAKLDRLRRAVVEASKQCGRNRLMAIDPPTPWGEVAARPFAGRRLLADPAGADLDSWPPLDAGGAACLAVGPEGGFGPAEVERARDAGWAIVGLGPTILRIETAGLVGCARLLALLDIRAGRAEG